MTSSASNKPPEVNGTAPSRPRRSRLLPILPLKSEDEPEGWLLTYLDMITLLLVMWIVMLAVAGKAGTASSTQAPEGSLGNNEAAALTPNLAPIPPILSAPEPAPTIDLSALKLGKDIEVIVNKGSVSFRVSSELLFASGQAELANGGQKVLEQLLPTLTGNQYRILVEGHTDDRPIRTERFPSNWELSAARASSVVRYLERSGISAKRMSATGYADTRPLGENSSDTGRNKNRRVELIMQTLPESP